MLLFKDGLSLIVYMLSFNSSKNFLFSRVSLKLKNGLKKHVRDVARIKHGFVELVVIPFTLNRRCNYVIPYESGFVSLFDKIFRILRMF